MKAYFITDPKFTLTTEGRDTARLSLDSELVAWSEVLVATICVPTGFEFDGESIPRWLHGICPPYGYSRRGAAIHDYLYRFGGYHLDTGKLMLVTRSQADLVYHEMLLAKGVPSWRANVRWFALRLVGWSAWNANRKAITRHTMHTP
jgi:hypothetical protein